MSYEKVPSGLFLLCIAVACCHVLNCLLSGLHGSCLLRQELASAELTRMFWDIGLLVDPWLMAEVQGIVEVTAETELNSMARVIPAAEVTS